MNHETPPNPAGTVLPALSVDCETAREAAGIMGWEMSEFEAKARKIVYVYPNIGMECDEDQLIEDIAFALREAATENQRLQAGLEQWKAGCEAMHKDLSTRSAELDLYKARERDTQATLQRVEMERNRMATMVEMVRDLLDEATEWICYHQGFRERFLKAGARIWCSQCNNYLRANEDVTLHERIEQALARCKELEDGHEL